MWKEQRQKEIVELIAVNVNLSVAELAKKFNLSEITIRKDIKELSEMGLLARKYGSFSIQDNTKYQYIGTPVDNRQQEEFNIKEQIANTVFPKLLKASSIFIDDSSTVFHILPMLKNISGLTIITPSILAINYLSDIPNIHTIGLGGTVCTIHKSFIGKPAIEFIRQQKVDIAIFSCYGISSEYGCVENFHSIVDIKKQAALNSKENIILISGSKWERNQGVPSIPWDNISHIVSNKMPPIDIQNIILKYNIELMISDK